MTEEEIQEEIVTKLYGQTPMFAVLARKGNQIVIGRDEQRWVITIMEIPNV